MKMHNVQREKVKFEIEAARSRISKCGSNRRRRVSRKSADDKSVENDGK
jgi:hypothetical protein